MKPESSLRQLQRNLRTIATCRGCRCRGCKKRRFLAKAFGELLAWIVEDNADFDRTVEEIAADAAQLTVGGH